MAFSLHDCIFNTMTLLNHPQFEGGGEIMPPIDMYMVWIILPAVLVIK